jgi:hypothetical protein
MKALLYFIALLTAPLLHVYGQTYTGPVPKPASGYGTDGTFSVATQSFDNPNFPGHDIVIYYPAGISAPVPTIMYSHAFGGNDPANISGFLHFAAGKGYAVVFVPYQTLGSVQPKYANLLAGFTKAARDYPGIIDTTRVGFVGHSFGGGVSFANAYYCFNTLHWGSSGRFIMAMAQWYAYNITQEQLQSFPTDVKLLTVVYEDDATNDHRMANDIFNTISIPAAEKDYLRVPSDTINGYVYAANHVVPNNSAFDALDYYAYYRLFDALCDYVFHGNTGGGNVALGNGSNAQVSMPGGMHNLVHSDTPTFAHAQSTYQYPCSSSDNPRQDHCDETLSLPATSTNTPVWIYPNPAGSQCTISGSKVLKQVALYNQLGQLIRTATTSTITLEQIPAGVYFVQVLWADQSQSRSILLKQ